MPSSALRPDTDSAVASTARVRHLVGRFAGSLVARRPGPEDLAWARSRLSAAEFAVWSTLGRADRAESIAVGRRTEHTLPTGTAPVWVAAALLHDVGKVEAALGTAGRDRKSTRLNSSHRT